jgi:hypothetical protein
MPSDTGMSSGPESSAHAQNSALTAAAECHGGAKCEDDDSLCRLSASRYREDAHGGEGRSRRRVIGFAHRIDIVQRTN